jgi:hypothetical protein
VYLAATITDYARDIYLDMRNVVRDVAGCDDLGTGGGKSKGHCPAKTATATCDDTDFSSDGWIGHCFLPVLR